MLHGYEQSSEIRFLTDGRIYEPKGRREGEFIVAFGELWSGPAFRPGLLVPFNARITRPGGGDAIAAARLAYPADPNFVHEKEYVIFLYSLFRTEVPAGSVISSLRDDMHRRERGLGSP